MRALATIIMNFDSDVISECEEMMSAFIDRGLYTYEPKTLDLDLKDRVIPLAKPSIKEPLIS